MSEETKTLRCAGCGLPYGEFGADLNVPPHVWERITRPNDTSHVLCANCICKRCREAGITDAHAGINGPTKADDELSLKPCPTCSGTGETLPQFSTLEELQAFIAKEPPREWHPGYYYNADGDQIEVFWQNAPAHNGDMSLSRYGITLYRDADTREVVGLALMGVVGRITLEQRMERTIRPHPAGPLRCPVCKTEAEAWNGMKLAYSQKPIECRKCGHVYTTEEAREAEKGDDES